MYDIVYVKYCQPLFAIFYFLFLNCYPSLLLAALLQTHVTSALMIEYGFPGTINFA